MTKKELNAIVTEELERFGIKKAKCSNSFECSFEKNIVYFAPAMGGIEDILYSQFLFDRFDFEDKYPFVMSLLHEIGHLKNNDDVINNVYAFCLGEKYKIQQTLFDTDDNDKEKIKNLNYRYFSLPDEIMATAWAVNYCKSNPKDIKRMAKRFEKALNEYNNK